MSNLDENKQIARRWLYLVSEGARRWINLKSTAGHIELAAPKKAVLIGDLRDLGGSRWFS